jgi:hypothetical protein
MQVLDVAQTSPPGPPGQQKVGAVHVPAMLQTIAPEP